MFLIIVVKNKLKLNSKIKFCKIIILIKFSKIKILKLCFQTWTITAITMNLIHLVKKIIILNNFNLTANNKATSLNLK
jgi:hypothetical protein